MKCRDCGAEIQFITNVKTYRKMPCETVLKNGDGKMTLVTPDGYVFKGAGTNIRGYEPHWVNCPGADQFRRERK